MKNITKLMAVLCCLLAVMFVFAACTPTETPTQEAQVTATPTPGTDASIAPDQSVEPGGEQLWKAGEEYRLYIWDCPTENDWVTREGNETLKEHWLDFMDTYGVTLTYVAVNSGNWLAEAMLSASSGEPMADMFHMGGPFTIPGCVAYEGTAPGTYMVQLDAYADFTDPEYWAVSTQQSAGTYGGKLYVAVPNETGWASVALNHVTFFNKALIEKGGYTADQLYDWSEKGEWTFAKLKEVAIACTDADNNVYGLGISENAMTMLALISANGGDVLTVGASGAPEFAANGQKSLNAINYYLGLCRDDKCVYMEGGVSQAEAQLFTSGKTAMMITYANRVDKKGPWKKLEFGIIQVPMGPDNNAYRSDRNWFTPWCVFKGGVNDGGAVQILSMYCKPEYSVQSEENLMQLDAEAGSYFKNEKDLKTLHDVLKYDNGTSYMVFWSVDLGGVTLCNVTSWNLPSWVDGTTTPETDYAANVDAVNAGLLNVVGMRG